MERNGAKDPQGPPDSVGDLPAAIAARVEGIVHAAEREAAAVQRDLAAQRQAAEAEMERYLAEARQRADMVSGDRTQQLRELTGELVERAEGTAHELEALLDALKRTVAALEAEPEDGDPAAAAGAPEPAVAGRRDLSAARLVAIEMAVAGRTRDEVDDHLQNAFDVDDTRALLDDVFGAVGTGL
jgi:small-conductance mechanosensitive channel